MYLELRGKLILKDLCVKAGHFVYFFATKFDGLSKSLF